GRGAPPGAHGPPRGREQLDGVRVRRRGRLGAAIVSLGASALLVPACGGVYPQPLTCGADNTNALILMAQAVPSATLVPCIAEFPAGWSYNGSRIRSSSAPFWLDSDRRGFPALGGGRHACACR